MRVLRVIVLLALLLFVPGAARADTEPPADAVKAAQELLALVSPDLSRQLTEQMTATFWPQVEERGRGSGIDDATLAEMRDAFVRIQRQFIDTAMKDAPAVYARHFTAAELHELAAFYRTPTGAKALRELPQVMSDLAGLIVPRLPKAQEEISAAFDQILKAHGYPK